MKTAVSKLIILLLLIPAINISSQDQQTRIDSLVNLLKTAGREWNDYSIPLVGIGDPAVPSLVEVVKDRSLDQWNRRIAAMTLNSIHSSLWVQPALDILFDPAEDPVLQNQVTAGLKGFRLEEVKDELWELFKREKNEFYKSNLANLLVTADTSLAYKAFTELFINYDAHIQRDALARLVSIRPAESSMWFMKAIQGDDWMTSNYAMDSLITSDHFDASKLLETYEEPGTGEEVRWRIVFVFGHRDEPESIPVLVKAMQEESWLVHTEAAVGLCRFDPEYVIPEMKSLRNDPEKHIRNNSRWVMKSIKDQL